MRFSMGSINNQKDYSNTMAKRNIRAAWCPEDKKDARDRFILAKHAEGSKTWAIVGLVRKEFGFGVGARTIEQVVDAAKGSRSKKPKSTSPRVIHVSPPPLPTALLRTDGIEELCSALRAAMKAAAVEKVVIEAGGAVSIHTHRTFQL